MGAYLKRLSLAGYRSYDNDFKKNTIDFQKLNIIIGANGAGKSNLVSFLEMISCMMTRGLRSYVSRQGGGNSLMYFGPKNTNQLFLRKKGWNIIEIKRLSPIRRILG